ncbi:glutaminase, partial [Bacillus mycoides]|uniref:glutaminase n=1 Tax=Bacillus mycoides TaxID=1405 RepID=UPI001642D655
HITHNPTINYSSKLPISQLQTPYLNPSLSYYINQNPIINTNIHQLIHFYTPQSPIQVNSIHLPPIPLIFPIHAYHPYNKKQIIPKHITNISKTF